MNSEKSYLFINGQEHKLLKGMKFEIPANNAYYFFNDSRTKPLSLKLDFTYISQ